MCPCMNRLERVIRELVAAKDYSRVEAILDQLCNDFAYAVHQPHARNGGLIGLAAAAIALGSVCTLPPVLHLRPFTLSCCVLHMTCPPASLLTLGPLLSSSQTGAS